MRVPILGFIGIAATLAWGMPVLASPIVSGIGGTSFLPNDDGTYPTNGLGAGTPPGTPVAQSLGFDFNFYGTTYTAAYINNNGNITFNAPLSAYTPSAITDPTGNPLIAPFFADVDTRTGNIVDFGTGTFGGHDAFAVNWPGVGYFSEHTDLTDTFQLLLVDRSDIALGDADFYFNYGSMQWETGDASRGSGGLGGICARVGFNSGAGTALEVPGSSICGALIDGGADQLMTATNDGVPGQFLFQVRGGEVITSVPEPATLLLLGTGLFGLGLMRWRKAA